MKPQAIKTAYITEFVNSGMYEKNYTNKYYVILIFIIFVMLSR